MIAVILEVNKHLFKYCILLEIDFQTHVFGYLANHVFGRVLYRVSGQIQIHSQVKMANVPAIWKL